MEWQPQIGRVKTCEERSRPSEVGSRHTCQGTLARWTDVVVGEVGGKVVGGEEKRKRRICGGREEFINLRGSETSTSTASRARSRAGQRDVGQGKS